MSADPYYPDGVPIDPSAEPEGVTQEATIQRERRDCVSLHDLEAWERTAKLCAKSAESLQERIAALEETNRELADALEALRTHPVVAGLSARIRDDSGKAGIPNPLDLAAAALGKAGRS